MLFNFLNKIFNLNPRVTKRAFQSITINFIVEWEDNYPAIRMSHFHVTTFLMNLNETQAC